MSRIEASQVDSAANVDKTSATGVEAPKHADDKTPEQLQHAFKNEGLLIRTLQLQHAAHEFKNCNVSVDQVRNQVASGPTTHSGLRKWSLAHAELRPQYFKMGPDVTTFGRGMAVLAMPHLAGEHVVGVHEKDQASGGVTGTMEALKPADAKEQIGGLLNTLKSTQSQHGTLENSEIQTVGIAPTSMAGLMFHPVRNDPKLASWTAAKPEFENVLRNAGPEFKGRTFPVFTFEGKGDGAELKHLGSVSA